MKNLIVQIYCSLEGFSQAYRLREHDEIKDLSTKLIKKYAERYNAGVELAKWCDYVKDNKRAVRVKTEKDWMTAEFLKWSLPEWQGIWIKKKVEIKWNARQRSFFLTYIR